MKQKCFNLYKNWWYNRLEYGESINEIKKEGHRLVFEMLNYE